MVILGLLLLIVCVAAGTAIAAWNTSAASLEALGYTLSGLTLGGVFLLGAAAGALALLGLSLVLRGARRKRARKAALQREVESVRSEQETLAEENARLQAELEQERAVYPSDGEPAPRTATAGARGKHAR